MNPELAVTESCSCGTFLGLPLNTWTQELSRGLPPGPLGSQLSFLLLGHCHIGIGSVAGSQGFGPFTAFPGRKQGAGWKVEHLGQESVPIWNPGADNARTLVTRFQRQALSVVSLKKNSLSLVFVIVLLSSKNPEILAPAL